MSGTTPASQINRLQARAQLLTMLRQFFAAREVLEVETPILGPTTGTDLYIDSFAVPINTGDKQTNYYLQTSPEFAMKRLLAEGSGPIYQIAKVFRADESSRLHNPEFTMLEWYRPGFTMEQLMTEVADLIATVVSDSGVNLPRYSYRQLFVEHLNIDPHTANAEQVATVAQQHLDIAEPLDKTGYLQQLMALVIEPQLPEFCFVYNFPTEQCALAKIEQDEEGITVSRRFELYGRGMELANGYQELTDATEQRNRFTADLNQRRATGRTQYPLDEKFLAALQSLPDCAGVALGIDRLLMLTTGATTIDEILGISN
ncbi:MAG: EF-P lysine aminoacylase EpmA [Pseudohongiellaceae bacterium]